MSSSASDRSPLFCRWNRSLYLLKLSQKTRCTILKYFDREDCPPLTFGLFAKACCFLQRFFRLRKELRLRRNYLLKKSAEIRKRWPKPQRDTTRVITVRTAFREFGNSDISERSRRMTEAAINIREMLISHVSPLWRHRNGWDRGWSLG